MGDLIKLSSFHRLSTKFEKARQKHSEGSSRSDMGNTLCTMDIPQEFIRDNTEVETLEDIPQNMPMDKESSILPIEPKALTNLF